MQGLNCWKQNSSRARGRSIRAEGEKCKKEKRRPTVHGLQRCCMGKLSTRETGHALWERKDQPLGCLIGGLHTRGSQLLGLICWPVLFGLTWVCSGQQPRSVGCAVLGSLGLHGWAYYGLEMSLKMSLILGPIKK